MGTYKYALIDFKDALESSFIEASNPIDDRYSPKVVVNDNERALNVLGVLKNELRECETFDFSVAFLTCGGIQVLVEVLNDLERRGVKGRILTSTYLNFNQPGALEKLLKYKNIEVRIYEGDLHAKGYFFKKDPLSTLIIGSSNLTQKALTCNKEWNILFRSYSKGAILTTAQEEFNSLWNDELSVPLTKEWLDSYSRVYKNVTKQTKQNCFNTQNDNEEISQCSEGQIKPNKMQERALEALTILHEKKEERALLISATGTGKTYLSALDVKAMNPKKILFIAHRKRILEASLDSFKTVLGNRYSYGYIEENTNASCQFAMVGTLRNRIHEIDPKKYDYIIIDEAHRSGAQSYLEIVEHFSPGFLLGMTATPSRTDGLDIYSLYNHVIAFRITLQDALDSDLLTPFHYFGIADLEINGTPEKDFEIFNNLTSKERVNRITEKIEEYTVNKSDRRGLIFCSRNDESIRLSQLFNEKGYRTVSLSGLSSDAERNDAIRKLEEGELEYIFSVDIMNEGVDIPSLNQIIMLRATESAVVFVQQLGRGLRKCDGKDYTLVLDFIGNYEKNFLIPIALSGDKTYSKDTLRRVVKNGSTVIPGSSTISFDAISEARIYKALEESSFSEARLIKREYDELKYELGRIPSLRDFDLNEAIDPLLIINKYGSYAAFLQGYEKEYLPKFESIELQYLKFISQKLAAGKRPSELLVLSDVISNYLKENSEDQLPLWITEAKGLATRIQSSNLVNAINILNGCYYGNSPSILQNSKTSFMPTDEFVELLKNPFFLKEILNILEFALERNSKNYSSLYKNSNFVLYQKYSREEVCRLLNWSKNPNFQNVGGYFHDRESQTFPVFINYEKDPSISETTKYEDRFINESKLIAISKNNRTLSSTEIQTLKDLSAGRTSDPTCYLFVRKNKDDRDEGKEFYFLGEIFPTGEFKEITIGSTNVKAVEITYSLDSPVRQDIYHYLTSNLNNMN